MSLYPRKEILLVDDTPSDVNLVRIILEEIEYAGKLVVVSNGQEALDFLFRRKTYGDRRRGQYPDLMFLDLQMPIMSGFTVIEEMRADPNLYRVPVIILSAFDSDEEAAHSYSLGAGGYIVKPTNYVQLKEKIVGVLNFWFQDAIH